VWSVGCGEKAIPSTGIKYSKPSSNIFKNERTMDQPYISYGDREAARLAIASSSRASASDGCAALDPDVGLLVDCPTSRRSATLVDSRNRCIIKDWVAVLPKRIRSI
jgi:hypothetical protein